MRGSEEPLGVLRENTLLKSPPNFSPELWLMFTIKKYCQVEIKQSWRVFFNTGHMHSFVIFLKQLWNLSVKVWYFWKSTYSLEYTLRNPALEMIIKLINSIKILKTFTIIFAGFGAIEIKDSAPPLRKLLA